MTDPSVLKGCKVLVVEDEMIVALDICEHLEPLGCEIVGPAPTVKKALTALETHTPDLALLDENLDGEIVTPIAETLERRNIPFVIVSGYNTSRTGDAILEQAPRVAKPAANDAIVAALLKLRAAQNGG